MLKAIIFFTTITAVSTTILWGSTGLWLTILLLFTLVITWTFTRWSIIRVPELEMAVIYNSERQAFARFLPPGRHRLIPFLEHKTATISLASASAKGSCLGVSTIGGISLDISWSVSYKLDPLKAEPAIWPKLARALPHKSAHLIKKHMTNCLHHVFGEYSIDQIYQPGIHARLEREIRQQLMARLSELGFSISRVMLGSIEMPNQIKANLEIAHERTLQVEQEAHALERLHQVISQFSEDDMNRLMELERIYKMGQNGVALLYPAMTEAWPSQPARATANKPKNSYTKLAANKAVVAPAVS